MRGRQITGRFSQRLARGEVRPRQVQLAAPGPGLAGEQARLASGACRKVPSNSNFADRASKRHERFKVG